MSEEKSKRKAVRIERTYPDDLQSYFVSDMVVQHQPDVFILSFFEVWPPPIVGETEQERQEILEALDYVEAKCVARLAITPQKMKEFVEMMSDNLRKHEHKVQVQSELEQEW